MSDDRASAAASAVVSQSRIVDQSQLANLLEQFRPLLRANARQSLSPLLRKRADESDLAQMTLSTAAEEFGAFRGTTDAELVGWLQAIQQQHVAGVVRKCKTKSRDAKREVSTTDDSPTPLSDPANSRASARPSRRMQLKELRAQIDVALADLPEDQQRAVRLKFLDEWTSHEIAEVMGKTERAVAGLLRRGMSQLKDVLSGLQ